MKPVLYKLIGTWNGWRGGIWSGEGGILYQSLGMLEVSSVVPKTISCVVNSSSHCQPEWWVCHFPDLYWPWCCWIESLFPSFNAYAQDLYKQLVASGRWQSIYLHCDQSVGLCPSLQLFFSQMIVYAVEPPIPGTQNNWNTYRDLDCTWQFSDLKCIETW